MRKGFLMITDALLAFLIISLSVVVTHQFLLSEVIYKRTYLQSLTSDSATLIEKSETENLPEILNLAPTNTCLKAVIRRYKGINLQNTRTKVTKGCPSQHLGEKVVSRRTLVAFDESDKYYMIIVEGWYKWV